MDSLFQGLFWNLSVCLCFCVWSIVFFCFCFLKWSCVSLSDTAVEQNAENNRTNSDIANYIICQAEYTVIYWHICYFLSNEQASFGIFWKTLCFQSKMCIFLHCILTRHSYAVVWWMPETVHVLEMNRKSKQTWNILKINISDFLSI